MNPAMQSRWVAIALAALTLAGPGTGAAPPEIQGPSFLPGDLGAGASAGDQSKVAISEGGGGFLVVWTDTRTSNLLYDGFGDDQSGDDIYAARLDSAGNLVDTTPIIVSQSAGTQEDPRVGWNGQNWLVVWRNQSATATYAEHRVYGARIAPDGTVLDSSPIELVNGEISAWTMAVGPNGSDWLVTAQDSGGSDLMGVRVAADGTVLDPTPSVLAPSGTFSVGPVSVHSAQGEYLVVYHTFGGGFEARRFASDLAPIGGPFSLPDSEPRVGSNGSEYFVVWDPAGPTLFGSRMSLDGTLLDPAGIPLMDSFWDPITQTDVTWDGTNWWVAHSLPFPDGGLHLARVAPDGTVLDSPPFHAFNPGVEEFVGPWEFAGGSAGGVQLAWADQGCNCADEWDVRLDPWDIHGGHVSAEGQLAADGPLSFAAPSQTKPSIAAGDGQFLAVFASELDDERRIVAQRLDTLGNAIDLEPIEIAAGSYVTDPAASWNGSLYMIVWSDSNACVSGTGLLCTGETLAVRMLPDGTVIDAEPLAIMPGNQPDVEALGDVFLVVARSVTQGIGHWIIPFAMRVDGPTGALLDPAPLELGWVFAIEPRVTTFMDKWLVVWEQRASHDETIPGTRYNFVEADGTVHYDRLQAGSACGGGESEVAASGAAALIVCRQGSAGHFLNDINGTIILPDESAGPSFTISDAAEQQRGPTVTFDGENFLVVWEDMRNNSVFFDRRTDLYGAQVSEAGTLLDPTGFPVQIGALPEQQPALVTSGANTLLAASVFRDDLSLESYRLGTFHTPATPLNPPDVSFSGAPTAGCAPLAVGYSDHSTGAVSSWSWSFGDGSASSEQNPTHVYPDAGTYSVYLTADGGQGASSHVEFDYVTVEEATAAGFTASPTSGCGPFTVGFTDGSAGSPTSWLWMFGDDTYSTERNPTHTYAYPGSFTVTLTAAGACGPDTVTRVGHVNVPAICPVQLVAQEEMSISSSPVGTYQDTHPNSNSSESLFELQAGTAEDPVWELEHRWRFDVGTGTEALEFYISMYKSATSVDDYLWEYSTDNVSFTPMATVTQSGWTTTRVPVPSGLQGSVWVRVVDSTDSAGGLISVGELAFERAGSPPPHPVESVTGLEFASRESLQWTPPASATAYDVMVGSLDALRANGTIGDAWCERDDHAGTTLTDATEPAPGTGYYYVVRGDAPVFDPGTLDNPPGLATAGENRDVEVGSAGGDACGDMP